MFKPKTTGSESKGQHNVTKSLKFGSKCLPRPGSIGANVRWVFAENKPRAMFSNNPHELMAERDGLEILGSTFSDIYKPLRFGEVFCQHLPTELVNLHLPDDPHPSPLKTKVEATDTGKERADCKYILHPSIDTPTSEKEPQRIVLGRYSSTRCMSPATVLNRALATHSCSRRVAMRYCRLIRQVTG
jgi:hypothetical protein